MNFLFHFISFHLIDGSARNFITFQFNKKKNNVLIYCGRVEKLSVPKCQRIGEGARKNRCANECLIKKHFVITVALCTYSTSSYFGALRTYTHHNKFLTSIYWHFFSAASAAATTFYSIIIDSWMEKKRVRS